MARPLKDGVDYFPKDTHFYSDDKVRILRAEFGARGMYLLDYLLCEVYAKEGYYAVWSKKKSLLTAADMGCQITPRFIDEFIEGCLRCAFFDMGVYKMFGVLTSAGIQRRYIRMFQSREIITINEEYWLLDLNDRKDVTDGVRRKIEFKSVFDIKNPVKNTGNTQRKEKERKPPCKGESNAPPNLSEVRELVKNENLRIDAAKFYHHYTAAGWQGISDWRAKAREWSVTEKRENDYAAYDIEVFEKLLNTKDE